MVAHIWNAQSQTFARTGNGNFAFKGDSLYSYGTGWTVAKLFRGVALINGRKASVTTSGHERDARNAVRNRVSFTLPDLPADFARRLDWITEDSKTGARQRVRQLIREPEYRDIFKAKLCEPGEYYWREPEGETRQPFGAWLCEQFAIPAVEYRNAAARLDRMAAKKERAAAKREYDSFVAESKRLADMPDSDFRSQLSGAMRGSYSAHVVKRLAQALRKARLNAGLSDKRRRVLWTREKRARAVLADFNRLRAIASRRSCLASLIRYVRAIRTNPEIGPWSPGKWRLVAANLAELGNCAILPAGSRKRLHNLAEACKAEAYNAEARQAEDARREREEREAWLAERRAAWLAGEPVELPRGGRLQRDDGTPYLRVFRDELQTSWGAEVPLAHAIKVFRFVKLCRKRGESWHRNGKTIRVGHFQVDSVTANGDFVAGCHSFKWEEVERVARMAGVFDSQGDDSALEATSN